VIAVKMSAVRIAWLIVFIHALLLVHRSTSESHTQLYAHIYFLLVAEAGLLCRWGPLVLFTLGGYCVVDYWQPYSHISSSHMDDVMLNVGIPAIAGLVGFIVGVVVESLRSRSRPIQVG
jgi:hypothetical protein